ncbi:MAG: 5-oxoprolinase/urea amidolyase family protein [Nakamurella sp.]
MHRYGDQAVLVESCTAEDALGLAAALRERPTVGQVELVPGALSVLLILDQAADRAEVERDLLLREGSGVDSTSGATITVDVCYDGADLAEVGDLTGLGADGVIAAHTGQTWTVAFGGFAPGFGYLVGDGRLQVPRRSVPRTRVPAGAVGLAGPYSGVYPGESPGGWQLIGRSAAPLWDLDRDPPALLRPGVAVRFRAVDALPELVVSAVPPPPTPERGLQVVRPGILTTIQDAGRPGYAALGVTRSGAADRAAHARANARVGNACGSAVLETTLGGLRVRAVGDQVLAVSGARAPLTVHRPDGTTESASGPVISLASDEVLELGTPPRGLRSYLAVRGGVDVAAVLGSRSTDMLSGLGPAVLRSGQVLPVGVADGRVRSVPSPARPAGTVELPVTPGPHLERLAPAAMSTLTGQEWQVTPQSNRVGLRVAGTAIGAGAPAELASAPLVPGAIQIPPSGLPVVFLRDHPTTGGYPVLAVLTDDAIDLAAQLRPGQPVRFLAD